MSKYKVFVTIGEQNKFWVVINNGNIIRNPIEEDLKEAKIKYYNRTNTCNRCGKDLFHCSGSPCKEYKELDWTGRWLCHNCKLKDNNDSPNSHRNIIKQMRPCRMGNSDMNSAQAFWNNCEELTCIQAAKAAWRGVKSLNKENDNYRSPIDHSRDPELDIIQTQGRIFTNISLYSDGWCFGGFEDEWFKEFGNMICYCVNNDGKTIERIYIFPKKVIVKFKGISIICNTKYRCGWYEQYRVKNENIVRKVNEIWKKILEENNV